jgi:hypothetical protein
LLQFETVKVRIKETPRVQELDGLRLDTLLPGSVRELSSSLATWLIAEDYADPEMRQSVHAETAEDFSGVIKETPRQASTRGPRRRADDW